MSPSLVVKLVVKKFVRHYIMYCTLCVDII